MRPDEPLTLVGAGLAGALLATLLAQRGWQVELFERRPDPRRLGYQGGRSINLALASRGLHALELAGLRDEVMAQAVMMRGRMVHFAGGGTELQPYGRDDSEVIWSVHRGRLNLALLDAAERAGARLHFDQGLAEVDFTTREASFEDATGSRTRRPFSRLVGCDGAGSVLRQAMAAEIDLGESTEFLDHGYRELEIPPAADGGFRIEPHALHIWPRGGYMCIALPNTERSFTVTLFLPHEGEPGFDGIEGAAAGRGFFERDFADALELIPEFDRDWEANPVGPLGTLRLSRWHLDERAVLLGDAAHAMVPFHGQGMNCAFEDCAAFARLVGEHADWQAMFAAFEAERRPNAEAIQAMALENYVEMRDRVDDADFRLQRALELELARRHPDRFVPRYSMVSFTRVPYAVAFERGRVQRALLVDACQGKSRLDAIDLDAIDQRVLAELTPLD